jgi:ribose 1,5-bisphosphokinase
MSRVRPNAASTPRDHGASTRRAPARPAGAGPGRLVAVVGPSGAGKDTLLQAFAAAHPEAVLVRRAITRPADAGGEDHEALTEAEFAARAAAGGFLFHYVAHGLSYGIPAGVRAQVAAGRLVLFNGSRAALPAARAAFPGLEVVMITAPAETLAARLAARGREGAADIAARLDRAALAPPQGAAVVVNDGTVAQGVARLAAALNLAVAGG